MKFHASATCRYAILLCILASYVSICIAQSTNDSACERLAHLKIADASVTLAQTSPAGTYSGPTEDFTGRNLTALYKSLLTFCRVEVTAKPTSDSDIKIALWLPISNWNGRFQGFGPDIVDLPERGLARPCRKLSVRA